MENLANIENWVLVGRATIQVMYNFWPCVLLIAGYCIYETLTGAAR
jgi:hypothetical protein